MSDDSTKPEIGEALDSSAVPRGPRRRFWVFVSVVTVVALGTGLVAALLVNIFQHKQEAKNPYLKLVDVTEDTTDPAVWGINWPREFDT